MKRTRYDSEYERVRDQSARSARPRTEFPEPEDIFDRAEAAERRARIDAARDANAAAARLEAEQDAVRKESARLFTLETNERHRLAEYRYHGVEPPVIDGVPTRSSFHMLMSLGWTIEEMIGRKQLVRPFAPPVHERRTRDQYDQNT